MLAVAALAHDSASLPPRVIGGGWFAMGMGGGWGYLKTIVRVRVTGGLFALHLPRAEITLRPQEISEVRRSRYGVFRLGRVRTSTHGTLPMAPLGGMFDLLVGMRKWNPDLIVVDFHHPMA